MLTMSTSKASTDRNTDVIKLPSSESNDTDVEYFLTSAIPTAESTPTDAEDFLEAQNMEFLTSLAPTVAFLVVLAAVGLVGNSLVLLVYRKRFKPSVTKTYVQAMSVLDLATNVFCLVAEVLKYRFQYSYQSPARCKLSTSLLGFLTVFSGFILVAVALDRQRLICQQRIRTCESVKKARSSIVACGVIAVLMNSPRLHLTRSQAISFQGSNVTGAVCVDLDPRQPVFVTVFSAIVNVAFVVSFVTMVVCYAAIARHLWQHKRHRAAGRERKQEVTTETTFTSDTMDTVRDSQQHASPDDHTGIHTDVRTNVLSGVHTDIHSSAPGPSSQPGKKIPSQTTLMFFVLTMVCVANYVPYLIVMFARKKSSQLMVAGLGPNVVHIMRRSYYLNSAINPFVYSVCSARFRLECRRLFSCKKSGSSV